MLEPIYSVADPYEANNVELGNKLNAVITRVNLLTEYIIIEHTRGGRNGAETDRLNELRRELGI